METDDREKVKFELMIPRESMLEVRRTLFIAGISLQEFFTQVARLVERHDERMESVIALAVERQKAQVTADSNNKLAGNSLYNVLEDKSPFK